VRRLLLRVYRRGFGAPSEEEKTEVGVRAEGSGFVSLLYLLVFTMQVR
jgi:hypothetical protein